MILTHNHSAGFYYTLLRQCPSIITFLQPDFTIQFHSFSFYAITNHQPEETLGQNFLQLLHPLDVQPLVNLLVSVKANPRQRAQLPIRIQKVDRSYVTVEATVTCVTSNGMVEGYVLYAQQIDDLTEAEPLPQEIAFRKAASGKEFTAPNSHEQEHPVIPTPGTHHSVNGNHRTAKVETKPEWNSYFEELQLYKEVLDKSMLVAIFNHQWKITQVNELLCQRTHYSREELIGADFRLLLRNNQQTDSFITLLGELIAQGREWRGEVRSYTKDVNGYWVEAILHPVYTHGQLSHYLFFGYEITDRKNYEDKIRQSEARLREAQAVAKIGSWEYNFSSNQMTWSDEVFNIYGIDSAKGVPVLSELVKYHHPEDWPHLVEAGERTWEQGETQHVDVRIIRPDNEVRYVNLIGKPVFSSQGKVLKLHGTIMDIDDRKTAEKNLQVHNQELERINKQLDRFVYSATHDLRAPLMSMKGLVSLALIDTDVTQQEKYFQMMLRSIEKLDTIIRDIIDISRNSRIEVQTDKINFELLIREIQEGLGHLPGAEDIEATVNVREDSVFYSDSKRLGILFNNLLSNAYRYIDPTKEKQFVWVEVHTSAQEAVIRVADNGIGIGQEHQNRIFEMFYRATDSKEGTGLGLYLVKEIVNLLGGTIQLQSQLQVGSTFTITLPNRKQESAV